MTDRSSASQPRIFAKPRMISVLGSTLLEAKESILSVRKQR